MNTSTTGIYFLTLHRTLHWDSVQVTHCVQGYAIVLVRRWTSLYVGVIVFQARVTGCSASQRADPSCVGLYLPYRPPFSHVGPRIMNDTAVQYTVECRQYTVLQWCHISENHTPRQTHTPHTHCINTQCIISAHYETKWGKKNRTLLRSF